MSLIIHYIKHFGLACVLFIVTVFVAIFAPQSRDWLLPILFLLLPFVDIRWRLPRMPFGKKSLLLWLLLCVVIIILLLRNPQLINAFVVMLLVAALPEEWFFRSYLQKQCGNNITAILLVSVMFTSMHLISSYSLTALLVFIPSVFFGWVYKKSDDLISVVMLHALSNLVYYIYLEAYVRTLFDRL